MNDPTQSLIMELRGEELKEMAKYLNAAWPFPMRAMIQDGKIKFCAMGGSWSIGWGNVLGAAATENDGWWQNHNNIALVAQWMVDRGDTSDNIVYMIEKPWKYTDEYAQAIAEQIGEPKS